MPKSPRLRTSLSTRRDGDTFLDVLTWSDFGLIDGFVGAIIGVIALVLFAVLLLGVILPVIALTLEVIGVAVLFTAGAIGRLAFGRPWRIEARTIGTPRLEREVYAKGLRGSREAIGELAAEIASGR